MLTTTEVFANQALGMVTAGGASAPAPGTVETWTISVTNPLPAAAVAAGTVFRLVDNNPAQQSEIMLVTAVSGTTGSITATVTRGAEGTTPVAHATNFTVSQVTSALFLNNVIVASQQSQQISATQRSVALTPWYAGLANRGTARCNVVCLGDSITEGQHAAGPPANGFEDRWLARVRDLLRARYPTQGFTGGGRGFIGAKGTGESSFTWPTTIAGSPATGTTLGPKGQFVQLGGSGQSVTYTLTGDSADIMWTQVFGGGTFSWAVDGGAATNVSTNGASTVDGKITHISLGTPGNHTLVLAWVSGTADIDGVVEYYGDFAQGIQTHDAGHFGWQTSNWVTTLAGGAASGSAAAIAALSPSLIIISLGVNDQFSGVTGATFTSNLQTIIADLKAALTSPFPSIVLNMFPPRTGQGGYSFPWSAYTQAAWSVAAADTSGPGSSSIVTVMDWTIGPRMPGADTDVYGFWQAADLVHPSDLGHQALADGLVEFLSWR